VTAERPDLDALMEGFDAGRIGALARAISWFENGHAQAGEVHAHAWPRIGKAWRTGVTGPPGAGKSTLVNALTGHWQQLGRRTALLAVDPSSPLSGGALLGDRVRMDREEVEKVFVRSMASRGSLGGLSIAAGAAADLIDAFGFEELVLETVGVGQAEVDIASAADTTIVVLTPASGDGVQAMKAGLMEVADLFVVNKADTAGAPLLQNELEGMLELRAAGAAQPRVLTTIALRGEGIAELAAAIEQHRAASLADGSLARRRKERALARVKRLVVEGLRTQLWADEPTRARAEAALLGGARPDAVAAELVRQLFGRRGGA